MPHIMPYDAIVATTVTAKQVCTTACTVSTCVLLVVRTVRYMYFTYVLLYCAVLYTVHTGYRYSGISK
jgi:hypothetical protein